MTTFIADRWSAVRTRLRAIPGSQWFLVVFIVLLIAFLAVLAGAPTVGRGGR
jgi:hypothetical protein